MKHKAYITVIKMIKYLTIFIMMLMFSQEVCARDRAVNIYAFSRAMPQRELLAQDGTHHKLSEFAGDFTILIFWSRNCMPCVRQLKTLQEFTSKTQGQGIRLALVSTSREWKDSKEEKAFLSKYGAPNVESYIDEKGALTSDLGIYSSPNAVLINQKGEEIGRISGAADWGDEDVIEYINKIKTEQEEKENKKEKDTK